MSTLWNYEPDLSPPESSIIGYDVESTDGSIGEVEEASQGVDDSYLVVDTGFWIFGQKRVVPARLVRQINPAQEKIFLTVPTAVVKQAPDYEPDWHDQAGRDNLSNYYLSRSS
jgi:hypothetical protein